MISEQNNNLAVVPAHLVERLRYLSGSAENAGQLTMDLRAIIYDNRWFKLFVPRVFGGLEMSFPQGVRLEEELARIDGSLGWTVTLCAGANLFVGYLDRAVAASIFSADEVCWGGSGQASGKAVPENGGYRVSGRWRYATGAPHLTHFTANCIIEQDAEAGQVIDRKPLIKSFFFPKSDVQIIHDWNTLGLRATASHSFEVSNLWVPESNVFSILPDNANWDYPIYSYPFLQFAEATLAANTLGMARHFLECVSAVNTPTLHESARTAKQALNELRTRFYDAIDASWVELVQTGKLSAECSETISTCSQVLVRIAREQVMATYLQSGLLAADATSEANRVWRDIFTASQHSLLR